VRDLILAEIAAIKHKSRDEGRYGPIKQVLHAWLVTEHLADPNWKRGTIMVKYDLDTYDYASLSDEKLLYIFQTFMIRQYQQR
jgi:hypothetical protein